MDRVLSFEDPIESRLPEIIYSVALEQTNWYEKKVSSAWNSIVTKLSRKVRIKQLHRQVFEWPQASCRKPKILLSRRKTDYVWETRFDF